MKDRVNLVNQRNKTNREREINNGKRGRTNVGTDVTMFQKAMKMR